MENSFEILLPGIPVSSTRGAFGWCTIVLIDQGGKKILFDTGSYNVRPLLLEQLGKRGLSPNDIDIVFISHPHYDHIVNAELFDRSQILISEADLNYALEANDPFVPVTIINLLKERLRTLAGEEYITEAVKAVSLPGHTPGHMGLFLENDNVIVAGDARACAFGQTLRGLARRRPDRVVRKVYPGCRDDSNALGISKRSSCNLE